MLCLAAVVGVSAAPPAPQTVAKEREQVDRKMFADQDKMIEKAKAEAAKGNYEQAISMITGVIGELTMHVSSVDSWIARERLREFSALWQQWREDYGKVKITEAQNAYAAGNYEKAVDLANKAKKLCSDMAAEADTIISASRTHLNAVDNQQYVSLGDRAGARVSSSTVDIAQDAKSAGNDVSGRIDVTVDKARTLQKQNEYRRKINPYSIDPKLAQKQEQIKALLAAGRTLMANGQYEEALKKVEQVFTINAFNADAAQLAHELYKKFYVSGYKRRHADAAGMLAYEAWQWVEPTFPQDSSAEEQVDTIVKGADDHGTQAKLDKIVFPKVSFAKTEISAVIAWLHRNNSRHDPVDKKGVIIEFEASAPQDTEVKESEKVDPAAVAVDMEAPEANENREKPKVRSSNDILVTLELNNVTLREVLNYICYLTGLKYSVSDGKVSLAFVTGMQSASFYVAASVPRLILNYDSGNDAAASNSSDALGAESSDEGGVAEGSNSKASGVKVSAEALKKFFELFGVTFPEGSSIALRGNTIYMKNSEENRRRMTDILQELNVNKPMVQVEVKSIELTDEDLEELGFNWSLGAIGKIKENSLWAAGQGANTDYTASGEAKVMSMLGNMLSTDGTTPHLISGLNLFPDIFGSTKPFGSSVEFNLSLTINALDRSDRTEIISAPKVLVNSGETATVIMGKRYYFPESWDELEIEVEEGGDNNGWNLTITEPVPEFGESELMGTTFTVTPTVQPDNKTIRMSINPKSVSGGQREDETYEIKLMIIDRESNQEDTAQSKIYKIWRPVIQTRELNVQVDVFHGETLVLGGLSDSRAASRLDKIPILADIPFIGRLFQSHSEQSFRNNTLIFVTAKLMDNSGVPVRRTESSFGIPEIGR